MQKWAKLGIVLVITLAALTLTISFQHTDEPRYEGRSLTHWLTVCTTPTATAEQIQQAETAVRHIGTSAVPFLMKWLERPREDRITALFQALIYKRDNQYRYKLAIKGFQLLGDKSAATVPELTRMLNDTNSVLRRQNAAVALASMGTNGLPPLLRALSNTNYPERYTLTAVVPLISDPRPVVPLLVQCTHDGDHTLVALSVQALGRLQIDPDTIVPAITNALSHPDANIRLIAAQCFVTSLDAEAYRAAPSLQNLLNDHENGISTLASNILARIQIRSSSNAPP